MHLLWEVEVLLRKSRTVRVMWWELEFGEQMYYRWRRD